jgi:type II secretory ATPase GspE/PulE/Tfp pilus assembly ATPase PilB-like protein
MGEDEGHEINWISFSAAILVSLAFGLKGMTTLRQSASLKAVQGRTSMEEVMRVTGRPP